MRLLLLLVLSACSGVQGIPMAPIRTLPPAWDSPATTEAPIEIGHHGARTAPPPPRGTDKRVLPPTKEPGIWASDGSATSAGPAVLVGVILPTPTEADRITEANLAHACTRLMTAALRSGGLLDAALALGEKERQCLAARLYVVCARDATAEFERHPIDSPFMNATRDAAKAMTRTAMDFAVKSCTKPLIERTSPFVDFIMRASPEGVH